MSSSTRAAEPSKENTYYLDPDESIFTCHVNLTQVMQIRLINIGYKEEDFEKVPEDEIEEYEGYTHYFDVENETFEEFEKIMKELGFHEDRRFY